MDQPWNLAARRKGYAVGINPRYGSVLIPGQGGCPLHQVHSNAVGKEHTDFDGFQIRESSVQVGLDLGGDRFENRLANQAEHGINIRGAQALVATHFRGRYREGA